MVGSHFWSDPWKRRLTKASKTVSPFFHLWIGYLQWCVPPFNDRKLCVSLHYCTIFVSPFHHNEMKVFFYTISPYHHLSTAFYHFSMWTCVYSLHHCTIFFTIVWCLGESFFCYTNASFHHFTISHYFSSHYKISHQIDINKQKKL